MLLYHNCVMSLKEHYSVLIPFDAVNFYLGIKNVLKMFTLLSSGDHVGTPCGGPDPQVENH